MESTTGSFTHRISEHNQTLMSEAIELFNRNSVGRITLAVAKQTSEGFGKAVTEKGLDTISKREKPLYDSWGRATYFGANLGSFVLPVYQPGTIAILATGG